jgi:MMP 1-O-methyltransferase
LTAGFGFGNQMSTMEALAGIVGELERYILLSERVPGWTAGAEALVLARLSYSLPPDATIVEIGSFLGAGAILLAGPRRLRGSGIVHCVDPFDGSGDMVSTPHYQRILTGLRGGSQRDWFERNIHDCDLTAWVQIHQGRAEEIARHWATPIDLLFLDGDQSADGALAAYTGWEPFLKVGGIIALHNSDPENHRANHDGNRRVADDYIKEPRFRDLRLSTGVNVFDVRVVTTTTFAVKLQ